MNSMVYRIVSNYLSKRVTVDLKDEFINASVHFNINNDIYKKYSSVEIEYMLSTIGDNNVIDYVELCSVCGYILYRAIENNQLEDEDRIEVLQIVLEVSNSISCYLRGSLNEKELYSILQHVTKKLNLSESEVESLISYINK